MVRSSFPFEPAAEDLIGELGVGLAAVVNIFYDSTVLYTLDVDSSLSRMYSWSVASISLH